MAEQRAVETTSEVMGGTKLVYSEQKEYPLLLSMPHSGTEIPLKLHPRIMLALDQAYVLEAIQKACDSCVPTATGFHQYDQTSKVWTTLPRLVIDVNRGKEDVDGYSLEGALGSKPHGLVWRSSIEERAEDIKLLLKRPYTRQELDQLTAIAYDPYIHFLEQEFPRLQKQYGRAVLLELHSMPACIPGRVETGIHMNAYLEYPATEKGSLAQGKVPDIVISDRGKCDESIIKLVRTIFGDHEFLVDRMASGIAPGNMNSPRARLADPGAGKHSLNLETVDWPGQDMEKLKSAYLDLFNELKADRW